MIVLCVVAVFVVYNLMKNDTIKDDAYDLLKEFISTFVKTIGGALGSALIVYIPIRRQLQINRLIKVMKIVKEMQNKMIEIESENKMNISNFKMIYNIYGSDIIQFLNGIVYNHFGSGDNWAKSFAQNEFGEMEYDSNRMRKVLLTLAYDFSDYVISISANDNNDKNDDNENNNNVELTKSITKLFKGIEIIHLLDICLLMDKAQCLYKMKIGDENSTGMIWIGKSDWEILKDIFVNNSEIYRLLVANAYRIDDAFDIFYQHRIFKIRYGKYMVVEAPYWIMQKYSSLAKEIDRLNQKQKHQ